MIQRGFIECHHFIHGDIVGLHLVNARINQTSGGLDDHPPVLYRPECSDFILFIHDTDIGHHIENRMRQIQSIKTKLIKTK